MVQLLIIKARSPFPSPNFFPVFLTVFFRARTDPASPTGHKLTSQLYFDEALSDSVNAKPPYAEKRGERDLMLQVTPSGEAYSAAYSIGLLME